MNEVALNIITTLVGAVLGSVSTIWLGLYNKKRDADLQDRTQNDTTLLKLKEQDEISAPERAFALLERLVLQQQKEFDQLKDFHYEETKLCTERVEKLQSRIDQLTIDHQECMRKHAISEEKLDALTKVVSSYESKFNSPNK